MAKKLNINWKLPEDIVKVIFWKLPFFDLPNCRIVCKVWNNLVLDYTNSSPKYFFHPNVYLVCTYDVVPIPYHSKAYIILNPKIHYFNFDTLNSVATLGFDLDWGSIAIICSCNGLLLITKSITNEFVRSFLVLNPMTKERLELSSFSCNGIHNFGFGFSPETKKYKLFRVKITVNDLISAIEVLRFGIDDELEQWKPLCSQPFEYIHCHGVYQDGVVYWVGKDGVNDFVIYGLDVETEIFETIAVLDVGHHRHGRVYFQSFNGTIYLIVKIAAPVLKMQVWIMRAKHSWIKEFVIDLSNNHMFSYIIKADEGRLFFQVDNDLFYIDKTGKKVKIKTLFNPNEKIILSVGLVESFQFGSLPRILAGNN